MRDEAVCPSLALCQAWRLHPSSPWPLERQTLRMGVPYFVDDSFELFHSDGARFAEIRRDPPRSAEIRFAEIRRENSLELSHSDGAINRLKRTALPPRQAPLSPRQRGRWSGRRSRRCGSAAGTSVPSAKR